MRTQAALILMTVIGLTCVTEDSWARFPVQHPVFPANVGEGDVPTLKEQAAMVMEFSHEEINDWIVAKSSFNMVACPNCDYPGGPRDRKNYWRWTADAPAQITCGNCGMVYPSEQYPMSQVDEIVDPTGQVQQFPYYPGEDGYKYYLTGKIDNARKQHMEWQAPRLAELYAATGDERYALRAAEILDRLAKVYPHYNVQICRRAGSPLLIEDIEILEPDENGLIAVPPVDSGHAGGDDGAHYPYWSNRRGDGWNGWFYSEMPVSLAYAWDRIASCDAISEAMRESIEDYLRATANYTRSYPPYLGNMDPSLVRGFAVIGRVIGEPEFVHDALRRVQLILANRFFPDGNWREAAPSYHSQTVKGLRTAVEGTLHGYSDPPGYVGLESGVHLEGLDPMAQLPMLQESLEALHALVTPTDEYACIHDTWSRTTRGGSHPEPSDEPVPSHLHWGMGHAMLGVGTKADGLQAHLHFSGGYGHTHLDTLNLMLFSRGRELISDIGYTHSIMRPFAIGSLAHNLVVVDGNDQRGSGTNPPADGYLVASGRLGDAVQYIEAGGEGAYPDTVGLYRRALSVVECPDGSAYVVDLFRVSGGAQHDWLLHGSADEDMTLAADLPLDPMEGDLLPEGVEFHRWESEGGKRVIDGVNNSWGVFRELSRGSGEETWSAEIVCKDGTGVRSTVLGMPGASIMTAQLPSVRRAREDSSRVFDYWMPALIVRAEGDALQSTFAAVHEPISTGSPSRVTVERLAIESDDPFAAGISVRGDGFTDYHLSTSEPAAAASTDEPAIEMTGRYAFVRMVDGETVAMGLLDGAVLAVGGRTLTVVPGAEGELRAVKNAEAGDAEHALLIDPDVAEREAFPGERVVVRLPDGMTYGLAVRAIRREGEATVIALEHRAGLRPTEDGVTMTHWPLNEYTDPANVHLGGQGWWETE